MSTGKYLTPIVGGLLSSLLVLGCGEETRTSPDETQTTPHSPPSEQLEEDPAALTPEPTDASSIFLAGSKGVGDPYFPNLGNGGYDVTRYLIQVTWTPSSLTLRGSTTIEAETTDNLSSFNVDLNPNMHVSSVTVNGDEADFTRESSEIIVKPVSNLPAGSEFQARFTYNGEPGMSLLENAPFDGGWFNQLSDTAEDFSCSSCGTYVYGEPSSSMAWHPVNDHPSDRAQFRIEMSVKMDPSQLWNNPDWEFVTNGFLIDKRKAENGMTTWIYETKYPRAPYLTTLAFGSFVEFEEANLGDVQLRHWAQSPPLPVDIFEVDFFGFDYRSMFEVFTDLFGPYPFDTYGYLVINEDLGLALETQTLSIFGYDAFQQPGVHVHELAHQWFGNHITLDNWSEIWLNEGFATYSQFLYEEAVNPDYDIYYAMRNVVSAFEDEEQLLNKVPPGDPGPEDLFSASVYFRGALTLHALRIEIGDEVFFASLRKYVEDFGGKNVTTSDFIETVEGVSGEDLEDFFNRWLYDLEMPTLPLASN